MHVFFVHGAPLCVGFVWIAERLPVVAGHDDERVLFQTGAPYRIEHASQVAIGFVDDVEVLREIPIVGRGFAQQVELGNAGARLIRMMRLRRPCREKKRSGPGGGDEVDGLVDHAAIFDAPRRHHVCAREVAIVPDVLESVAAEKPAPAGPFHVTRCDEDRAIASALNIEASDVPGSSGYCSVSSRKSSFGYADIIIATIEFELRPMWA